VDVTSADRYPTVMMAASFDVLETLDDLRSAGFTDSQARTLADGLQNVVLSRQGELVTKADLRAELAELRAELKKDHSDLRDELRKALNDHLRWTIATLVLLTGALFSVIKLL